MDKVNMTGTRAQLYNGLMLLFTFFSCRLVYGTYMSLQVFSDIWAGINATPKMKLISPTMAFATSDSTVPAWLGTVYLASNMTLNFLNFYWFFMMIRAVRKRFEPSKSSLIPAGTPVTEVEVDLATVASGTGKSPKPRRRKA